MTVRTREQTGEECYVCPYCSRDYRALNERGEPARHPAACERCGCPMDIEASRAFADGEAEKERDPSIAQMATLLRGGAPMPGTSNAA